ncbi:MAG: 2-hydroxyacid dehydrogenase [Conexivisphaerales archaeon]
MPKVVVLSPLPATVVRSFFAPYIPQNMDLDVITINDTSSPSFIKEISEADVIIGDYTFAIPITEEFCKYMKNVKLIQQPSTGYDHIDVEACRKLGIPVANIGGANSISVAEHTIALALSLLKRIPYAHQQIMNGRWTQAELMNLAGEVYGKVWGILGMGRTGKEVSKRAVAMGAKVVYFDKIRPEEAKDMEFKPLHELLNQSDIISVHLPLTDETRSMIGEKEFRMMKPTSLFINVSRGEIVDEGALAKALSEGWIAGAGVDVFSEEPLPSDHSLVKAAKEGSNLIMTPHIAGATNEARMRIIQFTIENVARVLTGEKPQNVVNM